MLEILYQDSHLVAVHKPPGLMVHRSELCRHETRFAVQLLRSQLGRHVFPAHRLDRGTSGVLLFAFDAVTAARLGRAFESRAVFKRYLAVVRGWPEPSGCIEHPLRRLEDGKDTSDTHAPRQDARTEYRRLACAAVPIPARHHDTTRVALVELHPHTGRQHQLRRHLKHISHPVLGDATYGKGPLNRTFAGLFGTGRLLLACTDLHLTHPADGRALRLHAPLEPAFAGVCARLGFGGREPGQWGPRALTPAPPGPCDRERCSGYQDQLEALVTSTDLRSPGSPLLPAKRAPVYLASAATGTSSNGPPAARPRAGP